MAFEALSEKPLRVEKMSVLDGIVWAFAPEYEHLMLALGGFEWINRSVFLQSVYRCRRTVCRFQYLYNSQ